MIVVDSLQIPPPINHDHEKAGFRAGLGPLICCCVGLTACTAAAPNGPDTSDLAGIYFAVQASYEQ
jgi:hypothetical protein